MAENSKIEWTDHTFNPWIGCQAVSPACDNCYAEAQTGRFKQVEWGPHAPRKRTSAANWKKPEKWNREAQAAGVRFKVFCASLADVFDNHRSITSGWHGDLWALIERTPHLDWLLLTKRPQNIKKMLPESYGLTPWGEGWPNVWLGTTAENQEEWDRRWYHLARVTAKVRFISCEPLLGPIDMVGSGILHWVICGGESGPNARPMHPDWARSLRDQCEEAGVPFHFKQWGEWVPAELGAPPDVNFQNGDWMDVNTLPDIDYDDRWCEDWATDDYEGDFWGHALFKRVGKKAAGRMLDGREWNGMPGER